MSSDGSGVYTSEFSDGSRQFEIAYAYGKLNGVMRRWAQNGQLILECNYANDVKEGKQYQILFPEYTRTNIIHDDDSKENDPLKFRSVILFKYWGEE